MLIPFIVLNKTQHAHGKSDDNQYTWHATSVKEKKIIRWKRKNLAGICIGCILFLIFWSCFGVEFLLFMILSPWYLKNL